MVNKKRLLKKSFVSQRSDFLFEMNILYSLHIGRLGTIEYICTKSRKQHDEYVFEL